MNSLSENEKAACRERLANLSQYIAPGHLPEQMQLCIFQQLKTLISQLPADFWCHFELLAPLEQNLAQKTQQEITNQYDAKNVYSYIYRHELLTTHACAAAICSHTNKLKTSEAQEKYRKYQSVIILCCLQLHIIGQHDSAIENGLREIRLIATTSEHYPLLAYLPPMDANSSSDELITALQQLRELDKVPSGRLQRGLSFLFVVIHDACRMAKGITRHRYGNYSYAPNVEEKLELILQAPTDDTDQMVSELNILRVHTNPELDESDEPLDVRPGKVIRIHEPSSPHTTQTLRVLQGKRLAEQLAVRQQSLPCSFEQASEWDIQHLVAEAVTRLSDTTSQKPAALLLLSLLSGRYPEQLIHSDKSTQPLQEFKQHPCLFISHSVPASRQHPSCDAILPKVREHLILPLPTVLKGQIITSSSSSADTKKLNAIIRNINERHQTRLTLGRITRFLEHWYLNQGLDRAEVALIRGEQLKSRAALSYSNLNVDKILQHHHDYIEFLFKTAELDPKLPPLHPTNNRLGSRLDLPKHVLHNLFALLSPTPAPKGSSTLDDILVFHNQYISYVWLLLVFVTGHRDVTAPMGLISDYNPHNRTWWISDKEIRHGLAARTVILPRTAAHQVELYKEHLRALSKRTRFIAPNICKRCESALSGSDNFLFAIMTPIGGEETPADLCPSLLQSMLGDKMPWARNWPRHHLRSELIREGVSPEQIDGWMGHEEIGEEAFGRHSGLSLRFLEHIADKIENILNAHKIEARSGWQTH